MNDIKKQALGRGLSALLTPPEEREEGPQSLSVDMIRPNPHQPRQYFSEEELIALSASIQEKGILQPLLIRAHPQEKGAYEIVAGERRWRAAKKIGLSQVPVIIKDFSDREALEVALLENIQRQDLNAIEEAEGYQRLAEEFEHTQESLAQILGKSRSHISNTLRLLTLPQKVRDYLSEGRLSAGHGRALIGMENPELIADYILTRNLSVRQAELLSKKKVKKETSLEPSSESDSEKEILKKQISDLLGKPVDLILKGGGGKVVISFHNPAELDELIQKFNKLAPPREALSKSS